MSIISLGNGQVGYFNRDHSRCSSVYCDEVRTRRRSTAGLERTEGVQQSDAEKRQLCIRVSWDGRRREQEEGRDQCYSVRDEDDKDRKSTRLNSSHSQISYA